MTNEREWLIYAAFVFAVIVFLIWYWRKPLVQQLSLNSTAVRGDEPVQPDSEPEKKNCTNVVDGEVYADGDLLQGYSGCGADSSNEIAATCVAQQGTFYVNQRGKSVCLVNNAVIQFEKENLFLISCSLKDALVLYFQNVYPLARWTTASAANMADLYRKLEFHFEPTGVLLTKPPLIGSGPANENILQKKLSRYKRIEVLPFDAYPPVLSPVDQFEGTLYCAVTGTGWFAECGACLYAYNTCHALSLLGASPEKILAVSGPQLRNACAATQGSSSGNVTISCVQPNAYESLDAAACQFNPKYKGLVSALIDPLVLYETVASCWTFDSPIGCGIRSPLRRVLVEMASMRGFDCVQILNERDFECPSFVLYCCEPLYHLTLLKRGCPDWGVNVLNDENAKLTYLNAYLPQHVPKVSEFYMAGQDTTLADAEEWAFRTRCKSVNGVLNVVDVLTTCRQIVSYGSPFLTFDQEIQNINWAALPSSNELERLQSYFSVVYGSPAVWKSKNLSELQNLWTSLEFRWDLPIKPTTPTPPVRRSNSKFYQSQSLKGTLDQDPHRPGENLKYVEVVRFGTAVSKYDNEQLFAGTYYWPVRGSGLFLHVGKTLFAYNKIHAFRLLGCTYEEIVYALRPNVIAFIQNESNEAWSAHISKNPTAQKSKYFKSYCNWNTTKASSSCPLLFDIGMTTVELCTPVVTAFINDFCTGASERLYAPGVAPMSFFDQDPFLDRMIAQVAAQRGFETCIFVKQVGFDVAQELLHCKDPVTSLMSLKKFTPFDEDFFKLNDTPQDSVNFYTSFDIPRLAAACISNKPYVPFAQPNPCVLPKTLSRPLGSGVQF